MPHYRELPPPPRLAEKVECFWIFRQHLSTYPCVRVVPDGCADLIYTRAAQCAALRFIAPMTRYADFPQTANTFSVGVRFRPAMWAETFRLDGRNLADRVLPLDDVWGAGTRELSDLLDSYKHPAQVARALAHVLPSGSRSPFQKAIASLEHSHGALPLDQVASAAGLSTRQFRRVCLQTTALSPKLLACILRFRQARARAAAMLKHHADLAAECGYADQSHLIAECRRFSGQTPYSLR